MSPTMSDPTPPAAGDDADGIDSLMTEAIELASRVQSRLREQSGGFQALAVDSPAEAQRVTDRIARPPSGSIILPEDGGPAELQG